MHLPLDVVCDAFGELVQVPLVLENGRDDLLHPCAEVIQRIWVYVPTDEGVPEIVPPWQTAGVSLHEVNALVLQRGRPVGVRY